MSIKDKLQIILITYNRANFVKKTFEQFFFEGSPIYDYDFLVLDNNSTDNTYEIVNEFNKSLPNIRYKKNKYNLGIAGNIAKAMEFAEKEYVWIIGDDDKFDLSNWNEVEIAINNNEKIICLARYALPEEQKNNIAYQLLQLTFITGGIYSTSLFNDTTIKNTFDNIFTLFPHISPILSFINNGGKIYVVNRAIADNNIDITKTDVSYIRGYKNTNDLYERTKLMTWILGYSNIISLIKNKKLQNECMDVAISHPHIYKNWKEFYYYLGTLKYDYFNYYYEIYCCLSRKRKTQFKIFYLFNLKLMIRKIAIFLNLYPILLKVRNKFFIKQTIIIK